MQNSDIGLAPLVNCPVKAKFVRGGTRHEKVEGQPEKFLQLPQVPLHYSSLPPPIGSGARGHRPPNEEVGGTMHCGPEL